MLITINSTYGRFAVERGKVYDYKLERESSGRIRVTVYDYSTRYGCVFMTDGATAAAAHAIGKAIVAEIDTAMSR